MTWQVLFVWSMVIFCAVLAFFVWWPRTHYDGKNPFSRGEDFWFPFRSDGEHVFVRGPDVFFFLRLQNHRLRRAVLDRLRKSLAVRAADICVRARDGGVRLEGHVLTELDREIAARLTAHVSGVLSVKNFLRVQPLPDWLAEG